MELLITHYSRRVTRIIDEATTYSLISIRSASSAVPPLARGTLPTPPSNNLFRALRRWAVRRRDGDTHGNYPRKSATATRNTISACVLVHVGSRWSSQRPDYSDYSDHLESRLRVD